MREEILLPTGIGAGQSNGITAAALKWTAAVLMLINHCCISWFDYISHAESWLDPLHWYISRPSFIIFAFLISEGMVHTRDRRRYIIRLLVFSLVSEIPYDLCFHHELIYTGSLNVGFTLLIGALTIAGIDLFPQIWKKLLTAALASLTASASGTSYGGFGVLLVVSFYVLRDKKWRYFVMAALIVEIYAADLALDFFLRGYPASMVQQYIAWAVNAVKQESHGILALPLTALYKGEKGRESKLFFYIFYPAHLLAIYLVTAALT